MSLHRLWLLPLITLLGACATNEHLHDTAQLPPGTGVMVATVLVRSVNNFPPPPVSIAISKEGGLFDTKIIPLDAKDNSIVLTLPAGKYEWSDITLMDLQGHIYSRMPFTVEAGKINYVGDLLLVLDSVHVVVQHGRNLPTYAFFVKNLPQYTLSNMKSNYPALWSEYPVVTHLTQIIR